MKNDKIVDHLFRHQYGKMVAILTRIFGLQHLEIIEDAVQDTFIKAMEKWKIQIPENPEAWLTLAAKNRAIDLLRKLKVSQDRFKNLEGSSVGFILNDFFLEEEIEDSQLRMIFTACHPALNPKDQISFALKTIAGFSNKEIAVALLLKEETVKKRLSRARKTIKEKNITFSMPDKKEVKNRISLVIDVFYLIFNEGFHSTKSKLLIQKELCGEAIRLVSLLLKHKSFRTGEVYALFALFCFHSARLEAKMLDDGTLLDLKSQDRKKWHHPLIKLGNEALNKAMSFEDFTDLHLEAAIASEHSNARTFEETDWENILSYHLKLQENQATDFSAMNLAIVHIQLNQAEKAKVCLDSVIVENLEKRAYLYYGILAEYYLLIKNKNEAIDKLLQALDLTSNEAEKNYLKNKLDQICK